MMDANQLVKKLKDMHDGAEHGDKVAMITLFGVQHAVEIAQSGVSTGWLAERAIGQKAYGAEISKGCKLSEYVRSL